MKIDGLTHPKTKELAYTLDIPLPHAIGLLELMWAFVGQQTPRGNVGRWSNQVIAGEAGWQGDADEFISALISVGFLDESEDHRLLVHDWKEHAPNWVHAKLKKKGRAILSGDLRGDLSEAQDPPQEGATNEVKPNEAKGSDTAGADDGGKPPSNPPGGKKKPAKPDYLAADVWNDYRSFRTSKRATLTATAWKQIEKELGKGIDAGHDPNEMLAEAMAAGWQGFKFDWYLSRVSGNKSDQPEPRSPSQRRLN